jgi:hypothetical protein
LDSIDAWRKAGTLPFVPTATMGRDPMSWQKREPKRPWLDPDKMTRWRLLPADYLSLLEQVKAIREVFTQRDTEPDHRSPGELGLGPYDSLYRAATRPASP